MRDEGGRAARVETLAVVGAGRDPAAEAGVPSEGREAAWAALRPLTIDARQADRGRLVSLHRRDPAHGVFDMLRTRVAQAMAERGWSRIAVTSPTKNCGKTFVSANLALSLARRRGMRVGLMDLDLRLPSLAQVLGVADAPAITRFLDGSEPARAHFRRLGDNLAVAVNGVRAGDSAERLHDPRAGAAIARARAELGLDLMLYDLPPMLACDDVLAVLPQADCVLFVVGGGVTRAEEIRRCAKLVEGRTPILGIVLNRAEDPEVERYHYGPEARG
jgi:protein-tyrosine kinase